MPISYDDYVKNNKKKKKTETETLIEQYLNEQSKPKTTTTKKKNTNQTDSWFTKGAFSDGYDFGDVTKTILGTTGDVGVNALQGIGNLAEGIADLGAYGVAGIADALGNDKYADRVRKKTQESVVGKILQPTNDFLDQFSVLGEKSDNIGQGLGYIGGIMLTGGLGASAGLGTAGVTALTTGTTFTSGFGNGMSEAYKGGATDSEATTYGFITGSAEALTELMFGGLGKAINAKGLSVGLSSADDMLAKKVSSIFKSQIAKNLSEYTIKAGAEGLEEVASGLIQAVGQKLTFKDEEEISKLIQDQDLLEQFIAGAVTSGIAQSGFVPAMRKGSLIEANKSGRDFITGLTQAEQKAIDDAYNSRVETAEREGITLTNKEKNQIRADVEVEVMQPTTTDEDIAPIRNEVIDPMLNTSNDTEVQEIINETQDLEQALRQQNYQYKAQATDSEARRIISEDASKYANNTTRTQELVDTLVNVSEATGETIRLTNNQSEEMTARRKQLAENYARINNVTVEEATKRFEKTTIDAYNTGKEIVINLDSPKALNRLVGHEVTHSLEGTQEYSKLQRIALDYAKTKGEYNDRASTLQALYEGTNANIDNELTSDLVGDYLFTDQNFINHLHTQDRNVFQKIYDEIKHLIKMVTAGSKEARQLEQLKHSFEKAIRENKASKTTTIESKSNLATEVESNTQEKEIEYSLMGEKGIKEAVRKDSESQWIIDNLDKAKAYSEKGIPSERIRKSTGWFKDANGKWLFEIPDNEIELNRDVLKQNSTTTLKELLPHEDLYEAYGDKLANTIVKIENIKSPDVVAQYDDKTGEISISNSVVEKNKIETIRRALLHEAHHKIQQIEGLENGKGGRNPISYYSSLGEIQATEVEDRSRKDYSWLRENAPESMKEYPIHSQIRALHKALTSHNPESMKKAQNILKNDSRLESLYNEIYKYGEEGVYDRKILTKMGITKNNAINDIGANTSKILSDIGKWFKDRHIHSGKEQLKALDNLFKEQDSTTPTKEELDNLENTRKNKSGSEYALEFYALRDKYGEANLYKGLNNYKATGKSVETSVTDNKGRTLTKEQEDYFKDSKVRDENGNLLTMYHGTSSGGHTVFDPWGAKVGLFGQGSYFTDNQSVAESYTEKGRGSNKQIYEVYLNITNPIDMDAQGDVQAWAKALSSYGTDIASHLESGTNEQIYRSALDYLAEEGTYDKYERAEIMAETFEKMGYDGITHIGGGRFNKQDGTRHRVYISLDSTQVKNVDNTKPTSDPDIRYSLSENDLKQKQLDIILKTNPMLDDYHTGIRTIEDIKTFDETINDDESFVWGDFSQEDAKMALEKGEITVYSSYPIEQGVFVSTSKNQARDYASGGKVYSKTIPLNDVAWLNGDEGQYAKVNDIQYSLSEVPLEQRVTGDELLDAQDLIEELESVGAKIDENGYVTVYHATTQENARKINESKQMKSNEPAVFFSTSKNAQQSEGRGGVTLEFRIPAEKLVLDDLFTDNADVKIPLENFYTDTLDVTNYLVTNDYSLSNENTDIAPTSADIFGSEVKLQEQVQEAIAPLKETIQELNNKITELQENIAPIQGYTDEDVNLKNDRNFENLEAQNIAPIENTTPEYRYENSNEITPINDPFESRDIKEVGKKNVKAYMYENPEVKPYFQQSAREMLTDLDNSIKGEKLYLQEFNPATGLMENSLVTGTKRQTTDDIADLLDNYKYTYAEIRKGLNNIIEDNGKENNAVSKRIEFMLHDRLMKGYKSVDGFKIPANEEYRALIDNMNLQAYTDQAYQEWSSNINQDELAPIENASNMNVEAENIPLRSDKKAINQATKSNEPRIEFADPMEAMTRQVGKQIQEGMTYKKSEPKVSPTKKQLIGDAYGKFQEQVVNRNYYIDKFAKDTGNSEVKFAGDMLNNFYGEVDGDILIAQTDNNGNAIGDSLSSLFDKSKQGGYYEAFNDYLMHYSNIDRHQVGKGSVVPSEYSRKMVAEYEKMYPTMRAEATKVWKYGKNLLANMQSNGLITGQFNSMLQDMYPHYVPFMFDEEVKPFMSDDGTVRPKKAIKRAEGNAYEILEIEEAFAKYTYRTKRAIRENSLLKEIVKTSKDKVSIGADLRADPTNIEEGYGIDDNGKYYATAYVNGDMKQATISEELYNELTKSAEIRIKETEQRYELITKPLQKVSEVRRKLLTEWNPMFIARNMLMDPQDAVLNSKYPTAFLKYYPTALAELTSAKTKEAKQFLTLYGSGNLMGEFNTNKITQESTKNKKFIGKVSQIGNLVELAPRYAEFKATIKDGKSVSEAMYNAREVTTNFGRGGYITKALNRNGFTFLNTSVQGFDKLIRNFSGENGARGVVSSLAKVSIFAVAPALLNALAFGDDDEEYEALPDYIKDNYYIIKTGDGEFIRIHKGRMASVFGSAGRRTLEYLNGDKEAFEGFLSNAYKQVGVQNPLDNNIFAPLVQAYNNEAWWGDDLVPTRLQDKPAEEQYDETTDEFSKWLGQMIGVSPYKINYVLEQYSGGIGDIFLPMITDGATNDTEGLGNLLAPMKDQFTASTVSDNKYVSEFYDKNDELKAKANSSNATEEDVLRNKYMYSVSSEMSELYKEKREVQNDDSLTKEEKYRKVQEIQKQINSLAEEGLNNYERVNKTSNYAMVGDREYYKDANDEWKTPYEDELDELNSLGMDVEEKSDYFNAKNSIYEITEKYKGTEDMYAERKAEIIDVVKNSYLTDDQKGYLYSKYYSKEKTKIINALDMDFDSFLDYESQNFVADKNKYGESINGSKKTKVFDYINSLNGLSFEEKVILAKLEYNSYDEWNYEIIDYLNTSSITYEEEVYILKKLGFVVDNEGNIYWD